MTNQTYNGWTNWATWNTALWMDNDEGLYRARIEEPKWGDEYGRPWTSKLVEELVEALLPNGTPDMNEDPAYYDTVNWQAIADAWNEE